MNILVISDYRDYHTTRPEAEIFKGLRKLGFNIYVLTPAGSQIAEEFIAVGIHVIDFYTRKKFDSADIAFIRTKLKELNIDILQLFYSKAIVNGIQAAKGVAVKVVLYRGYSGNIHWYDPFAYIKYLHPRVDKIFCNSIGVEQMFRRQLFLDKNKLITINKGHRLDWFQNTVAHDIRAELGIPADALLLVNVGNNRRMKGIKYLLGAMNLLPTDANIHLLLIGRDMDTPGNLKVIKSGNHSQHIHILGFRNDVLSIVASTDAFILSSIKGESITKSVIEAMSLGVAPVISDIAGNIELVVHNENGLVFPSKNIHELAKCMMLLYNNRGLAKEFGKKSQLHISEKLNSEHTIQQVALMCNALIKE